MLDDGAVKLSMTVVDNLGAGPDVLWERAMEKNLFGPGGDAAPGAAGFQEFFLDFTWPSDRWSDTENSRISSMSASRSGFCWPE